MDRVIANRMPLLASSVVAALVLTLAPMPALAADFAEQANQALGLYQSEVVEIELDATPGVAQTIALPVEGETLMLNVSPYSVRSDEHYQILHHLGGDQYIEAEPGAVRTIRGTVEGFPQSVVAGGIGDDGLTALIDLGHGDAKLWVEPLARHLVDATERHHAVYFDGDTMPHGGSCATEAEAHGNRPLPDTADGGGCEFFPCVADLGVDTDWEFWNRWGAGTENRINLVTNLVNIQYERDVDITHVITTIIIRMTPGLPYTGNTTNTILNQMRTEWINNQAGIVRDVAELFSGKALQGAPIGQAWNIGVVCNFTQHYCVIEADFSGNMSCITDLSAHELGHLWNGFHCSCPGNTMNASLTCTNIFSQFNINRIVSHRNSRFCLEDTFVPIAPFPIEDQFNDGELDLDTWLTDGADMIGVEITDRGNGEPSPPTSVEFSGDDSLTTGLMDATEDCDVEVSYWWQRTGDANGSPEPGEDLVVEYRTAGNNWIEVARHFGDGPDDDPYEENVVVLPSSANHAALQVRWRELNGESSDYFFVDDVRVGCPEVAAPPEIVHGSGLTGNTRPFSGYIDPRIESDNGVDVNQGLDQVALLFSEPVESIGGGALSASDFAVTETGGGAPPTITNVDASGNPLIVLDLSRAITIQEWTTVQAMVQDQDEPPMVIVNNGNQGPGVDETDRVDIGYLPADVDQSSGVTPFDLLRFRQIVNDDFNPPQGADGDFVDSNRDDVVSPFDLLTFRQMINGDPPATQSWSFEEINNSRP